MVLVVPFKVFSETESVQGFEVLRFAEALAVVIKGASIRFSATVETAGGDACRLLAREKALDEHLQADRMLVSGSHI